MRFLHLPILLQITLPHLKWPSRHFLKDFTWCQACKDITETEYSAPPMKIAANRAELSGDAKRKP